MRCPDAETARAMESLVRLVRKDGDTVGGQVEAVVRNAPVGLGDPVFRQVGGRSGKSDVVSASTKGFEIGSGFAGTRMRGSEHNDVFLPAHEDGRGNEPRPTILVGSKVVFQTAC